MSFLADLARGHQIHEGYIRPGITGYPRGSLSYRNQNPGNLRYVNTQKVFGGAPGEGGFARFPSYEAGFQALMADIRAKLTGKSAHINYAKNPRFLDYVRVYAPEADGNAPDRYCAALCKALAAYGVTPQTPLSDLARIIEREDFDPAMARQRAQRMAERSPEPRKGRIMRRITSQS